MRFLDAVYVALVWIVLDFHYSCNISAGHLISDLSNFRFSFHNVSLFNVLVIDIVYD